MGRDFAQRQTFEALAGENDSNCIEQGAAGTLGSCATDDLLTPWGLGGRVKGVVGHGIVH